MTLVAQSARITCSMENHDLYREKKVCCNFLILYWKIFFSSVAFSVLRKDLYTFPVLQLI